MTGAGTRSGRDGLRIAAGVLHYRSPAEVRATVNGVLAQTRRPDEILVMDHASGDASPGEIRDAFPELEVVELPDNRGAAGGMTRLIEALLAKDADAIFILPDDMELAADALEHLAARLEAEPELGAVGPIVAYAEDRERIFYAGGYVDRRTWDLDFRHEPPRLADWEGKPPQRCEFLGLAAILIRTEAAREAPPLPGHFYHHLDDVDYTLQLASRGWKLECIPAAVSWQSLGGRSPYLAVRNRLGLVARNAPRRMLVRELLRVVSWLVRDAIRPRTGSRDDLKPRLIGLIDFCRGRWGAPASGPERR